VNVVGIDPGLSGALAWVSVAESCCPGPKWTQRFPHAKDAGKDWEVRRPTVQGLIDLFKALKSDMRAIKDMKVHFVMEELRGVVPGQRNKRSAHRQEGTLEGVLTCLFPSAPVTMVQPKEWQSMYPGIGGDKMKHIKAANGLHPYVKVSHDGEADAMLIAYWGISNIPGINEYRSKK
jgi:hypothetical protein